MNFSCVFEKKSSIYAHTHSNASGLLMQSWEGYLIVLFGHNLHHFRKIFPIAFRISIFLGRWLRIFLADFVIYGKMTIAFWSTYI